MESRCFVCGGSSAVKDGICQNCFYQASNDLGGFERELRSAGIDPARDLGTVWSALEGRSRERTDEEAS